MRWIEHWGGRAIDVIVGLLLLVIVVITFSQVLVRYIFGGALTWSEELLLVLWVWMIQAGAIRASHMRIKFVAEALPRVVRRVAEPLLALLAVVLLALLTNWSWKMVELTQNDYYIALDWLSVKYTYLGLVIVGPLWIAVTVVQAVRRLRRGE